MARTCGSSIIKLILILINLVYLVLGAFIIYIGAQLISSQLLKLDQINLQATSVIILIAGIVIVLTAGLGFFGTCCESSCMLNMYGILLIILIAAQGYVAYKSYKSNDDFENIMDDGMNKAFGEMRNNNETAKILQQMQKSFKCCGWDGPDSLFEIPASCCDLYDSKYDPPNKTCSIAQIKYREGCKHKFDWLKKYFGTSTGIVIAIIMAELILVFAAFCLARDF